MPTQAPLAVSYGSLFRYATLKERGVIALGCVSAAATGRPPSAPPAAC
jgi:hypothetical protein